MQRSLALVIGPGGILLISLVPRSTLRAQTPPDLERERHEFNQWLSSDPLSPYAALAIQPLGQGVSIGQEPADIRLAIGGRATARISGGSVVLETGTRRLVLPPGRPVALDSFRLIVSGPRGRETIAAFGTVRGYREARYYPYAPDLVRTVTLEPPERRGAFRTLGLDGAETDATEAGIVEVAMGTTSTRLRVYRVGAPGDEEADLLILFRDATNGKGSYPAGRFVVLVPAAGGKFKLDFNRARNPFCAYNSAYACPAPWPGNGIAAPVAAGETYQGERHSAP